MKEKPSSSATASTPARSLHFSKVFACSLFAGLLLMTVLAWWYTSRAGQIPSMFIIWLPWFVLVVGVVISFLIFTVLYNLSSSQVHAETLAKQMTRHLRESEERFRQLSDNIDEVFWLSDPHTEEMLYVSKAYEKIWGRSLQSVYFSPKSFFEAVHPEDMEHVNSVLNASQPVTSFDIECRIVRPEGSIRWIRARSFPIRNAAGEIYRVAGVAQDITEKRKVEETLRQAYDRMEILARATHDVIWDWNFKTQKVWWNSNLASVLKHRVDDETEVQFWFDQIHDEDRQKVVEDIHRVIRENSDYWSGEYRFRAGDGSYRMIYDRGIIIRDGQKNAIRMIGGMEDITERKKLESQLLQSQKMETVGTLAGGIAHDLNNQLTPVRGYLDMVLKELSTDHPLHPLLKEANASTTRCAEIIHRLLTYSRPSSHKKMPFAFESLFIEIRNLLSKVLPSTIKIVLSYPPGIWVIEGNETELQTVLMNLAANARDAMPEGGILSMQASNVTLEQKQIKNNSNNFHYVVITVQDNGVGISPENLHRIYEPFFTTKEKGRGTGLGLAMVFKIVQDHNGWIEVTSQVGKGTTFEIYLPAKIKQEVKQMPKQDSALSQVIGNGETILFADDEDPIRNLGRVFLERLNYKAVMAVDGENALEIYRKDFSKIDVVLMDMTMPKMTGKQTLEQILVINPKAKVVIMSGYTAEGLPEELITSGASFFLQKPYTLISLGEVLKKVLNS